MTRPFDASTARRGMLLLALAACVNCHGGGPGPGANDGYVAGRSYFGRNGYVEYIAGDAPVILTAPHGGAQVPSTIPDRTAATCGGAATTVTDLNTIELVRAMQQRYFARFGHYPHVILMHLARRKLDANRVGIEAACGNADADGALIEWHKFIDVAKQAAIAASGKGWYMDMHGHGHSLQRIEIGYLIPSTDLNRPDATLNASTSYEERSSIRTISVAAPLLFADLLRGSRSLGTLYASRGIPAIPSSGDPRPANDPYFDGGDDTRRHSCGAEATSLGGQTAGMICGVQIETNLFGLRDDAANRNFFGDVTAVVLETYLMEHWGLRLGTP